MNNLRQARHRRGLKLSTQIDRGGPAAICEPHVDMHF